MTDSLNINLLILQNLVKNEQFARQTLPFIKEEYYEDKIELTLFKKIREYIITSNRLPQKEVMAIEIDSYKTSFEESEMLSAMVNTIYNAAPVEDHQWLLSKTEEFCKNRSLYLAITDAISIYDGTNKTLTPLAVPDIIKEALSISFNSHIGEDWTDDAESRYERYVSEHSKLAFDIDVLNDITKGGCGRKTLNMFLGGVHVGKTMSLIHLAAGYSRKGYNVIYFTLEMDEDEIFKRIDANMLKVPISLVDEMGKDNYIRRVNDIKKKGYGKIKCVQFPTASAHVGHFKAIIDELKLKQHWNPDIIIIDYLGITASAKQKVGVTGSHFYLKSVAEELRAMAKELDVVVWTAAQFTREGMASSDVELTNIAESIGITHTGDLILALTRNEELDQLGQIAVKQLKNRYKNMRYKHRFVLGVDLDKQLLYDVEEGSGNWVSQQTAEPQQSETPTNRKRRIKSSEPEAREEIDFAERTRLAILNSRKPKTIGDYGSIDFN